MTDTDTIQDMDVQDDDGFEAFLSSFSDDKNKRPSGNTDEATDTPTETTEQSDNDQEGEPEEGSEQTENDPDDAEVEIKVGEETKKATLRELKRLYGQEASLTQKSQKVSEQMRAAETHTARVTEATKVLLDRAQERYKPYAELDWLTLARPDVMDKDAFAQLRADAETAKRDVDFLTQELDGHMKDLQTRSAAAYREAAQACVAALTDPKTGIEGFNEPLYNEMVAFADEMGIPNVRNVTVPAALKVLHMAMQYSKAQKAAKTAEAKAQRVKDTPQRVMKPGSGTRSDKKNAAMQRLRQTHDDDDVVNAFMATF